MAERSKPEYVDCLDPSNGVLNSDDNSETMHTFDKFDQVMSGVQIDKAQVFENKRLWSPGNHDLNLIPIMVDFRSILISDSKLQILQGVSNRDLLHAVIGLYDICLSEMTPDTLYSSVCDKWARTIVLLRNTEEVLGDMKHQHSNAKADKTLALANENMQVTGDDKYAIPGDTPCTFHEVFSDSDQEIDSGDDEVDESVENGDFSQGINSFIQTVRDRRLRRCQLTTTQLSVSNVGIENRIIAAATFEKSFVKPSDRVVHLTLIAVRPRYRRCNIGQYLVERIKDQSVVGKYDAVVVHADNSAIKFFKKNGFCDDVVLNSRWNELAEQYTQCTLMSYLPPFLSDSITHELAATSELDIAAMDNEILRWRQRSVEAYRAEVSCFNRLRHEVVTLRQLVSSQQKTVTELTETCEQLRREKFSIEKEFLDYRLSSSKLALGIESLSTDSECEDSTEELISQLKLQSARLRGSLKDNMPN